MIEGRLGDQLTLEDKKKVREVEGENTFVDKGEAKKGANLSNMTSLEIRTL